MAKLKKIINGNIKTDVKFLDKTHEKLLTNKTVYPSSVVDRLNEIVKNGLSVSGRDFLIYYLFHKKGCGISQKKFIETLSAAETMMKLHVQYLDSNIFKIPNIKVTRAIAENIGESIGMLTLAKCFDISNADWDVIPENNKHKTFDFKLGVSKKGTVQLETKGTAAIKINLSGPTLSILAKKKSNPKAFGNYYYGSIVTIDNNGLKCYLLDPPANDEQQDLTRLMLISRMRYYNRIFNIIAPKSELISIVEERIQMLEHDDSDVHKLPKLKPINRNKFNYHGENKPTFFFNSYYQSEGYKFGGRGFYIDENSLFFVGVTNDLLCEIIDQNVRYITRDYKKIANKKLDEIRSYFQRDNNSMENIKSDYSQPVKISIPINALHRDDTEYNNNIANSKFFSVEDFLDAEGDVYFIDGIVIGILDY